MTCHEVGFFYLQMPEDSDLDTKKMLQLTQAFFDLPQAEKDQVNIASSLHFRGYGKLGQEITEGIADFKETYDFGLEQKSRETDPAKAFLKLQGPNQWPTHPLLQEADWKGSVLRYLSQMQKLGEKLMEAMAMTLGLHPSYFAQHFRPDSEDSFAMLRLLRYPPVKKQNAGDTPSFGVGPHVDSGCLVILLQDEVGGLEVQNRRGEWIQAPPMPNTFVVNIGKMLQVWSRHYFLATPHRVLNSSKKTRYSIPFFFEPSLSTVVEPLDLLSEFSIESESKAPIDPIVYGEYMLKVFERSFPRLTSNLISSQRPEPLRNYEPEV